MRCQESALEGKVFVLFLSLILLMNLKMRFHRAREEEENCQEEKAKFLPDDVPDFLRSLSVIDVTSRKSENNQFFYWDLIPKENKINFGSHRRSKNLLDLSPRRSGIQGPGKKESAANSP